MEIGGDAYNPVATVVCDGSWLRLVCAVTCGGHGGGDSSQREVTALNEKWTREPRVLLRVVASLSLSILRGGGSFE